jgi:hypothetical protein
MLIPEHGENLVNGLAADPCLDAKPTTGHEGPEKGGHVRAHGAEGGAAVNREGDAVFRARMGVEHHRNEHDDVAKENRQHRLPPIHSLFDEG